MNEQAEPTPTGQSAAPPSGETKRKPRNWVFPTLVIMVAVAFIPLVFLISPKQGAKGTAGGDSSGKNTCQDLIVQAMQASDHSCSQTGPNQACYGNTIVKAELVPDTLQRFSERGDVVDIDRLVRLSAAPLDLSQQVWGVAVLRLLANLPRSLPGETVTMFVFGNTTVGSQAPNLESFYFYSQVGQIACADVPYDGIMITMPDGAGIDLKINGAELTLTGNASLKATRNDKMNVSVYQGSARIMAGGEEQYFNAGEQVSVDLGGTDGTQAIGPPSAPGPLSSDDNIISCAISGQNCPPTDTPPAVEDETSSLSNDTPTASQLPAQPSTATSTPSATPTPTPTATFAETNTPRPTHTLQSSHTPKPTHVPQSNNTPKPTHVPQSNNTPKPTDVPQPTNIPKPTNDPKPDHTPKK